MYISKEILSQFLDKAADQLRGDWVIIGGIVPYLLNAGTRPTMDIDLAGPETANQADTLILLDIAESLSLPVEAINQAAAFFLYRIPNWQQHLILVRKGVRCSIYRPDLELFFRLKLQRASDADIEDLAAVWRIENNKLQLKSVLVEICKERFTSLKDAAAKQRVAGLMAALT